MSNDYINIKGARVNNLKNIDLKIPRDKFVVITGISGSGKSSLAFDTLFAEGQRRFAESLSSFARQFLGRMTKPAVDYITGIPPAIAIEQKVNTRNPRSTIGSNTEIYDYLRLLFAKIGKTYSPISGKEVKCNSAKDILDYIYTHDSGSIAYIMSEIKWKEENKVEKLLELKESGFNRLFCSDGRIFKIDEVLSDMEKFLQLDITLLIDRIVVSNDEETRTRALDSIQTAFLQGHGYVYVSCGKELKPFSNIFEADGIIFDVPNEYMFSYNNPLGACPKCGGYGKIIGIDESLIIPDQTLSIYQGAVACWRGEVMKKYYEELIMSAYKFDFPIHRPYNQLSHDEKKLLWSGNQYFSGIEGFFKWVESNKYKIQFKYLLSRYSGKTTCPECEGGRLKKESLWVKIGGKNIVELMSMNIGDLYEFFNNLSLDEHDSTIAERPIKEIKQRLEYIKAVGLTYLTLNRNSNTLSGGESQRINLVRSLGNNLVGALYILDEPSIGLHSQDTKQLITVLKRLRDLGNTVIVVEHDEEIIRAADELIDIGPYAGVYGGEIVYQGRADEGKAENKSLTIDYLQGVRKIKINEQKRNWSYYIEVCGATQNNLKNVSVKFPLRCITAITGVSGSGKSSLVGDILYPAIYRHINQLGNRPGTFKELKGDLTKISSVEYIDQNPIGKSTRSNPVTYLKIYDEIRRLFSEQPYAKLNGYGHSHFSFNIDGGRCPECLGEGVITIEMQFMSDVSMVCESCGGKRFKPDILEVRYQGKNVNDVLNMSVDEAIEFFSAQTDSTAKKIAEKLQPLQDVGLSYIQLGQSSSSLSGGESQRIKLASFLSKNATKENGSILFIFDEPTTGLHFYDIEKLLKAFNALIDRGHSIIVVEHNLDIIRASDWVIELGPDAGDKGGEIIFEGTPENLALHSEVPTGKALSKKQK
ncbi:MAG: excinuclease ABC subunit UvrA [Bacteroidales bacterium]|nr:excinuclease ABC subunit UvrA [Bacteroidales bacterium]